MWWTDQRKMLCSGGLTALAVILALVIRRPYGYLAALAMAVSTLGDGLLAGYPKVFAPVRDRLIKGGLIFLAAHILYILALILASGREFKALLAHFWVPFAVFAALTVLHGLVFYFRASSRPPFSFFLAAFFYLLTVAVHAAAAVCVCGQTGGRFFLNIVGAILFFLSDAILLASKYGADLGRRVTDLIWFTYAPAQLCLILGFFLS